MQAEVQSETVQAELPSFYQAVCGSQQHTQRAAKHISDGVTGIVDKVQTLLIYWEKKFKALWDTDKDAFIRQASDLPIAVPSQNYDYRTGKVPLPLTTLWQSSCKIPQQLCDA